MSEALTASDNILLASLEQKNNLVCDFVTAVAKKYQTGLYLYSRGGMGKSYTVLSHLKALGVSYCLHNSRMTAKGLFCTLAKNPDMIHVLEDCERITKDADAQGVLRSALWAQPGHDRVVTWTTATDGREPVTFRGGLILISNRPLANLPELNALATRIVVHRLEITEAELAALMRKLATDGYHEGGKTLIASEDCLRVTELLLSECTAAGCPLDLRLQQKSFQTYLQSEAGLSKTHWRDIVAATVRQATHHFLYEANTLSQEDQLAERRNIVREIISQTKDSKEQVRLYKVRTGFSRADFYRLKDDVKIGGSDIDSPSNSI